MRIANSPSAFGAEVPGFAAASAPRTAPRARRSTLSQYVQFSLVGATNAVVDLGVLNVLLALYPTRAVLPLLLDNTIAVALAILNSYLWNTRWTFRAAVTHRRSQRALFVAQALVNIALNNIVLLAVASVLPPSLSVSAVVLNNIAKLAAMLVASTCSFLLLRLVVFRSPAPARAAVAPKTATSSTRRYDLH